MAKEILKLSSRSGAFISKGDVVEFEIPYGTKTITVSAVEIDLSTGEVIIHGVYGKTGSMWRVLGRNIRRVENKKLTVA